jgi:cyclopropane fatty-acyl-phospholipid synthase-like methyltransferase
MIHRLFFEVFYFRRPPWDTCISPPELFSFIRSHPPARALDLGCGTGTNAITLAQHGWQVVGVDFVGRAIRAARHKARQAGVLVDFHTDDVTRLSGITSPFDLVLDIGCLHSLSSQQKAMYIDNLTRLLTLQGTFLLYTFITADETAQDRGLTPGDLTQLASRLRLVQRQDGTDRGDRASAWLTYQR